MSSIAPCKNDIRGKVPKQKPLLTQRKNNTKAHLTFTKEHLNDPEDFQRNIQLTDKTEVEIKTTTA